MMPPQKPGRSRQDYGTPWAFVHAVERLLGIPAFYRDLAADPLNAKAERYYTAEENALVQAWFTPPGAWNWLNPPYADIVPWVMTAKLCAEKHGVATAVLVPASLGTDWWRTYVHEAARVLAISPRLVFDGTPINPKTGKPDPYPKDLALLLYAPPSPLWATGYALWRWR